VCDRCNAIGRELFVFQRLQATINDVLAQVLMAEAVNYLQAERAALHPADANEVGEQGPSQLTTASPCAVRAVPWPKFAKN
jgi:hypothetical protein